MGRLIYMLNVSVDVSSIKELVRRWYPDVLAQRGWKAGTHRALDDIRESLAEMRLYRELVFSTGRVVVPPVEMVKFPAELTDIVTELERGENRFTARAA